MSKEIEKYSDSIYMLNKLGGLMKIRIDSLNDYNHIECELHHYIPYHIYETNKEWFEAKGIKQKLILVSKPLHERIHQEVVQMTDSEFERKYKISRWKLIFNKKFSK